MTDRRQSDFDRVWNYYFVAGHTHGTRGTRLVYREAGGSCCAIGVLITDEEARHLGSYSLAKRVCMWDDEARKWVPKNFEDMPTFVPEFIRRDPMFYVGMQDVHDRSVGDMGALAFGLEQFAAAYGLTVSPKERA